jgi:hypothetical protein
LKRLTGRKYFSISGGENPDPPLKALIKKLADRSPTQLQLLQNEEKKISAGSNPNFTLKKGLSLRSPPI